MDDAGANYRVFVPNDFIQDNFISTMQYFPTTFFVDSDGEIFDTVIGAHTFEEWGELVDKALESIEKE